MQSSDGGGWERSESNAPAFEENDLDGALVVGKIVYGAGGAGSVA